MTETSRRLSPERRARIVDAARHLILRQGLRATTMEAIAREAKIAKPTLYGYFPDKEAVFSAIIQALGDELLAAFKAALAGEGDVASRIGAALAANTRSSASCSQARRIPTNSTPNMTARRRRSSPQSRSMWKMRW
jgi:AcrR family transcriptional regulator